MSSTRNWPVGDCNTYVEPLEQRRLLSVSLDLSSTLLSPDPAALQQFGSVLATQGNLALVGVPGTSVTVGANTFDLAGSAYLIDTTTDSVVRRFDNPDPGSFDQFGAAVAFAGSGRIAIAAPGDAASGGSVYIYADATDTTPDVLSGAAFTQTGLPFPGFGTSISAYGDDGLLVDVNVDPFSPQDSGLVQLYDLNTLGVIRTFVNPDSNNAQVDHFGSSMAVSGDQALFSARILDTNGAPERVVFQMNADTGDLVRTYHQPTPDDQQVFGQAIAFAGSDILISAPQSDFNLPDKQLGEVYHFDATSGQLLGTIQDPDQTANDAMFGSSIAISGNVAVIGAPLQTGQAWQVAYDPITFEPLLDANGNPVLQLVDMPVGSVFAIDLTTGDLIARADSPTPAATADSGMDNNFGQAVAALDNNRFLVGTPGDDHAANDQTLTDAGAVYLYTLQNSVPENQPPVADAGADQSVDQGATLVLTGIASHDPDGDALMYSWSIDGGDFSAPSTDPTLAFNQSRPGQYDLTLLVADPSGATSTDNLLVTVNNVAPQVSAINAASAAVRQQQLAFSATASDAGGLSDLDSATWSFGDGSAAQTAGVVNGQITASHAFVAAGVYNVTLAVSDVDQAVTTVSFQVTVSATALVDGNLLVGGTTSSSAITITPGNGGSGIMTNINGASQNYASVPGKVIVFGGPGNDLIVVAASIDNDAELYGGGGNNVLKGGSGNDIIVGGDGSDLILGGNGRDLLIGGRGVDMIVGNQSDDILIAGPTVHDNDPAALRTIMTQWTSSASYSTRVANLQSTMLRADVDVFDDGAVDILTGNAGTDWFIFNQDGPVRDYALDLHGGETFNDVDIVSLSQQ